MVTRIFQQTFLKMKEKLAYIVVLGMTLLLGYFLLAANRHVYASDIPYIAFSSKRSGNYDIYIIDINGKNLQQLTDHLVARMLT